MQVVVAVVAFSSKNKVSRSQKALFGLNGHFRSFGFLNRIELLSGLVHKSLISHAAASW